MVLFGLICDLIGRRNASVITALLQIVGVGVMVFYTNPDLQQQVLVFAAFFGLFGIGVGGEYPLTARGAASHYSKSVSQTEYEAESDEKEKTRKLILIEQARTARRGETFALIFAMQGIGAVFGSTILLILIYFSGQGRTDWYVVVFIAPILIFSDSSLSCSKEPSANVYGNDPVALNSVWRTFYLIGLIFVFMILLYRWLILSDKSDGHLAVVERKKLRAERLGKDYNILQILQFYVFRLLGTGKFRLEDIQ
jgi:MFS family permease